MRFQGKVERSLLAGLAAGLSLTSLSGAEEVKGSIPIAPSSLKLNFLIWPNINSNLALMDKKNERGGSACVVGEGGQTLLTAKHVVDDWEKHPLHYVALSGQEGEVEVIEVDPKRDLAALRIKESFHPAPLAPEAPYIGDEVVIVGILGDGTRVPFVGSIIGIDKDGDLIIDGMGAPGMSGACVLNRKGQVVGIAHALVIPFGEALQTGPFSRLLIPKTRHLSAAVPLWR